MAGRIPLLILVTTITVAIAGPVGACEFPKLHSKEELKAAADYAGKVADSQFDVRQNLDDELKKMSKVLRDAYISKLKPIDLNKVKKAISGNTIHFKLLSVGNHIDYYAKNGNVYIWNAHTDVIIPGKWTVRLRGVYRNAAVCVRFPKWGYDDITQTRGGDWLCRNYGWYLERKSCYQGDVLGLSKRQRMPFKLTNFPTNIDRLKKRLASR